MRKCGWKCPMEFRQTSDRPSTSGEGCGWAAPEFCLSMLWIKCSPACASRAGCLKLGACRVSFRENNCMSCTFHNLTDDNQEDVVHERMKREKKLKGQRNSNGTAHEIHWQNPVLWFPKTQRTTVGFFSPTVAIPDGSARLFPSSNSEVVSSDDWRCPIVKIHVPRCYSSICRQRSPSWKEEIIYLHQKCGYK